MALQPLFSIAFDGLKTGAKPRASHQRNGAARYEFPEIAAGAIDAAADDKVLSRWHT